VKNRLLIAIAVVLIFTLLLTSVALADQSHRKVVYDPYGGKKISNWLDMSYFCVSTEEHSGSCYCGPSSGLSIGQYYRDAMDPGEDEGLITTTEDFEWGSDGTSLGVEPPPGDVDWAVSATGGSYAEIDSGTASSGLKSAEFCRDGGTNDISAHYACPAADYLGFYVMKDDDSYFFFEHGDMLAKIAVRITDGEAMQYCDDIGYQTIGDPEAPILADRFYLIEFRNIDWAAETYDIYLNGDLMKHEAGMQSSSSANAIARFSNTYPGNIGSFWIDDTFSYRTVTEDFEWGSDGTSLGVEPPLGDVDWWVNWAGGYQWGTAVAEIETDIGHVHSGAGSARLNRGESGGYLQAYYMQAPPTYRRFFFQKDASSVLYTTDGDGEHRIFVRVIQNEQGDQKVQYYDGVSWEDAYTVGEDEALWHCIEFRNIDWTNATYEIWVDGVCAENDAAMNPTPMGDYNGMTAFYNSGGDVPSAWPNDCWIDDVLDLRVGYPDLPADDSMYDSLWDHMDVNEGFFYGYTDPLNYGPGFVQMALHYGYDNFCYDYDDSVNNSDGNSDGLPDDFKAIVDAIDNGWPVALAGVGMLQGFQGVEEEWTDGDPDNWPCELWHWIAIKGYTYWQSLWDGHTWDHFILCTDSYSGADNLMLDWDNLVDLIGENLRAVIIRDGDYSPEITRLELLPETGENPVNTIHEVTATVYDQFGHAMNGVDVSWSMIGVGSFSGTPESPTDANGQAHALITSSAPGTSTVRCEVMGDSFVYDTGTCDWIPAGATTLELLPQTGENPVNTIHEVTATVYDQFGYAMDGVDVSWSVVGVGSFSGTPESPTDANGQAHALITSSAPGTSTVTCEVMGNPLIIDTTTADWTCLEDFEWGSGGTSLAASGGDVTWGVQAGGYSNAVITTTHRHGTKGGRLYCDGSYTVTASYSQSPAPTYRAFYVRKDNYSYFQTTNTYFYRMVSVTINTNEMLQYYDGSLHNVCQLDDYTWYLIELKNINYSAGTFDIYVDGELKWLGARTSFSWSYSSPVHYQSSTALGGHGYVYLDTIS
jgi:hypothetical protein